MSPILLALVLGLLLVVLPCRADTQPDTIYINQVGEEYVTYPVAGTNLLPPATYVYESAADGKVRVASAKAIVSFSDLNTGSETTTTTRAWARSQGLPTDDAGHILANRLGGTGKEPVNIFPQSPNVNRGVYRMFESKIADCVNASRTIASLAWTFTYVLPTDTRPIGIYYCVTYPSNNCLNACDQFVN